MQDGVLTTVVMLHEKASEANVVDMNKLHDIDGVNVPVCVDVSSTVDTAGCGLSMHIQALCFM